MQSSHWQSSPACRLQMPSGSPMHVENPPVPATGPCDDDWWLDAWWLDDTMPAPPWPPWPPPPVPVAVDEPVPAVPPQPALHDPAPSIAPARMVSNVSRFAAFRIVARVSADGPRRVNA